MTEIDHRMPVQRMAQHARLHPLIACAAVALTLTCVVGIAAMTGAWSHAGAKSPTALAGVPDAPPPPLPQPAPVTPEPHLTADTAQNGSAALLPPAQYAENTPPPPVAPISAPVCTTCGVVSGISSYRVSGKASGLGAVGGGLAGAGVGQLFGRGNGRIATTVAGAALGAMGGHAAEKNIRSSTHYRVTVRMRTGTTRTFRYPNTPPFSEGQSVRVKNGVLVAG